MDLSYLAAWAFLFASLVGAAFTINAYRPFYAHRHLSVVSFFAGWLTNELALHNLLWQIVLTFVFAQLGALQHAPGVLALGITLLSWVGLGGLLWIARSAGVAIDDALSSTLGADYEERIAPDLAAKLHRSLLWRRILLPFPIRHPEVERERNLSYHRAHGLSLKLDVYRNRARPSGCPVLMQIHGGAWVLGSKNEQGLPLMHQLAAHGWVCVSVDYRLSPHATFPEHLIDLKHAIAWIRSHIAEYGGDPDMLFVTGGSAGGHLASLVALTANEKAYQPGFEDVDTRVRGCVSFYGVYDFADRGKAWRHQGFRSLLERHVMKAALDEAAEAYDKASPIACVNEKAPPFLVVHGTHDTLVPVGSARDFVAALRKATCEPVVYAEIPGAQHAFEIFPSLRTDLTLRGVERFLAYVLTRAREQVWTAPAAAQVERDEPAQESVAARVA